MSTEAALPPPEAARPSALPFAATPAEAARLSGLTRTEIYKLLNAGTIEARASGRRTLVVMEGLVRHVQSLPRKRFGVGSKGLGRSV